MLSELESYANPDGAQPPPDAQSVMACHSYLKALNKGFLNNKRDGTRKVGDLNAPVLRNIEEGFQFFKEWWIQLDGTSMYNYCK